MLPVEIPTDNMYKFFAILSALIYSVLIMSVIYLVIHFIPLYFEIVDRFHEADRKMFIVQMKIDSAKEKNIYSGKKEISLTDERTRAQSEMENMRERIEFIKKWVKFIVAFFVASEIFFFWVAYYTFRMWYNKLQKYQDIIIKKQASALLLSDK